MISLVFAVVAVAMLVMFVVAARLWIRRREPFLLLLLLVVAALVWDNTIVAAGRLIGAGPLLEALSVPRYVGHALFTPLLILIAVALGARLGVVSLRRRGLRAALGGLTVLMVALGCYTEIVRLEFAPEWEGGSLRYVNAASVGPPVPAIVAIIVVIVIGIAVWRRSRWPWMAAGASVMFVAAAAGASIVSVQNLGELALITGVLATAARATAARPTAAAERALETPAA